MQALAGPAVASCPKRTSRTGGALVVDAFMGAADNPVGHYNRLGSGLGDERQHLFRHPDVIADVGLALRKQRPRSVASASSAGTMPTVSLVAEPSSGP